MVDAQSTKRSKVVPLRPDEPFFAPETPPEECICIAWYTGAIFNEQHGSAYWRHGSLCGLHTLKRYAHIGHN